MKVFKGLVCFLKRYGIALGVLCFGFHLYAQAYFLWPFWDFKPSLDSDGYLQGLYDLGILSNVDLKHPEIQRVAGGTLMLAGIGIWAGVRYGLFERLRGGSDKLSGEE